MVCECRPNLFSLFGIQDIFFSILTRYKLGRIGMWKVLADFAFKNVPFIVYIQNLKQRREFPDIKQKIFPYNTPYSVIISKKT